MSSTPSATGKVILVAHITASEGKEVEIATILKNISKLSNSDDEPGCLTYRVTQHKEKFVLFEEYENAAAIDTHKQTPIFGKLAAAIQDKRVKELDAKYYQEI